MEEKNWKKISYHECGCREKTYTDNTKVFEEVCKEHKKRGDDNGRNGEK